MKSCSWCGKENEEEVLRCVGCGTEFKAEEQERGFERLKPELPFPVVRLAVAFCVVVSYYFLVPLAMLGVAAAAPMLKINLSLFSDGPGILLWFIYLLVTGLLLPASFYFIAFMPVVMKENDVMVRKAWWNSAIGRSLWLAFTTPIAVILVVILVINIIHIFS
ncbi:MAG TPA: hypothetical protein VMZ27_02945 [Candidatus Saccharimonadales bacterium]|nr:hypothetical protein [Candidatus Saccharimonadales bacterium]